MHCVCSSKCILHCSRSHADEVQVHRHVEVASSVYCRRGSTVRQGQRCLAGSSSTSSHAVTAGSPARPLGLCSHVRYAMKYGQFAPTMSAPSSSRPSAADPSVTVNRRRHGAPAPNLRCAPQFRGHVQGIPQWKNRHCENNTS